MKKESINLRTFTPSGQPNQYLVCPKAYCQHEPDAVPTTYPVSVETLRQSWLKVIASESRTHVVENTDRHIQAVQVTLVFRFRDYVHIDLIEKGPKESTFAIYSHSRIGHYDFGVNKARVKRWIGALDKMLSKN